MEKTSGGFYKEVEMWLGLFNQLLFIYRDTRIPKPMSIETFLEDASKLLKFIETNIE